jgi:nondiscriminating glutamyl-tRNA synthetase
MSDAEYLEFAKPFVKQELKDVLADKLELSLLTFKTQISYCVELNGLLQENFIDVVNLDNVKEVYAANGITDEEFALIAQTLSNVLKDYPAISVDNTNEIIEKIKVTSGLKGKKLFLPIRLLAIGKEHGPEMPKILTIVGKEKLQENVNKYLDK